MSRRRQPQAEPPADSVQDATEDAPSKEGSKKGSILPAGLYHSLDLASVLALVFGGCCTYVRWPASSPCAAHGRVHRNVWTYEELLRMNPRMGARRALFRISHAHGRPGSALTFSQMLFIAAQALPGFVVRQPGRALPTLAPRRVPLQRWALQVLVLTSSSLLNNWVFKVRRLRIPA
jgi:UDP-xylose/UDP-N-acetylglucosamine transporter B4